MKLLKLPLYFFLLLFCTYLPAQDVILETYASGFSRPVDITSAGDERLFITEQRGRIKIIDSDGTVLSSPFLDIQSIVNDGEDEQGLLGLAFHPDYANNGYFYVNFTQGNEDTRISRFSVSAADPNVADPNSEVILMTIGQPFWNHDGGCLKFGPDGYLYIGLGDGGSGGDPGNRAQNPQNLLGKMLRIDVNNGSPYGIPADNPFVGDPNVLDEIWAIGVRNPWRYSFDRETGDLWMGDVGQGLWEEINMQPASSTGGENYGWRCYEGDATYNTGGCGPIGDYVPPVYDYNHSGFTHCSVTGGFVYRGCNNPDLVGHYIYADYCSGRFWSLSPNGSGGWTNTEVANYGGYDISSFGEDMHGELYVSRLTQGRIYKITSSEAIDIQISAIDNVLTAPAGYESYQWFLDGVEIQGADAETYTADVTGIYTVEVTTDNGCSFISDQFGLTVGIYKIPSLEKFEISPNPFSKNLTVTIEVNESTLLNIQLLDLGGRKLMEYEETANSILTKTYPLEKLSSGVYLLKLETTHGVIVKRVIKN